MTNVTKPQAAFHFGYNGKPMIKALLLDFDGVIMDTESPEVELWQEIYAEYGEEFPLATWIHKVVGSISDNFDMADNLAAIRGEPGLAEQVREQARILRVERMSRLEAMPGVRRLFTEARRLGVRLAVVSSSPHWWVDGFLDQLDLRGSFEAVICREDAGRVKPAPDLYLKALERLGTPAEECLVIEDSVNGTLAAHAAGLKVVGVPNAITAQGAPLEAELVLASLEEFPLEVLNGKFEH